MRRLPRNSFWIWPLVTTLVSFGFVAESAAATGNSNTTDAAAHPGSCDVWIVSTRHLACPWCEDTSWEFDIRRWNEDEGWQTGTFAELVSEDPGVVTAIYVHGNRIEPDEVCERLWQAHAGISDCLPVPVRLVFWSWPSDKIKGQIRDVRRKRWRSSCEAYYLAHFLSGQQEAANLMIIGYSFGARIVTGGLHLLAGGSLDGYQLGEEVPFAWQGQPRVVLLAPAVAVCDLVPGGAMELAWERVEQTKVIYNSRDPVLKRYWLTDRVARPRALGYQGVPWSLQTEAISQSDVRASVGRTHAERRYFGSPIVTQLLRDQVVAAAQLLYD